MILPAHSGAAALDLTGPGNVGTGAGVFRAILTEVGQQYRLTFYLGNATGDRDEVSGNTWAYQLPSSIKLLIGGVSAGTFTNADVTWNSVNWRQFGYSFTAQGASTRVTFLNGTPDGDKYAGLDDVAVVAVPEPGTWAMMIAGFAVLGRTMRRRPKAPAGREQGASSKLVAV